MSSSFTGAVLPGTKLQEHSGSEKAWVYSTVDFAEEEQKMELFCLRFGSLESAQPAFATLHLAHLIARASVGAVARKDSLKSYDM